MDFADKKESVDDGGGDRVHKDIDVLLSGRPEELKRIQKNRAFADEFESNPVKEDSAVVDACGKNININAILKANLENRSIYTVNSLCDMFLSWRLEQLKKYLAKKKGIDFNYTWLIILVIICVAGLIFFLLYIMPRLGSVVS